ncbi:MAG: hypothetical protein RSB98_02995 [Raoultibacter sp.]
MEKLVYRRLTTGLTVAGISPDATYMSTWISSNYGRFAQYRIDGRINESYILTQEYVADRQTLVFSRIQIDPEGQRTSRRVDNLYIKGETEINRLFSAYPLELDFDEIMHEYTSGDSESRPLSAMNLNDVCALSKRAQFRDAVDRVGGLFAQLPYGEKRLAFLFDALIRIAIKRIRGEVDCPAILIRMKAESFSRQARQIAEFITALLPVKAGLMIGYRSLARDFDPNEGTYYLNFISPSDSILDEWKKKNIIFDFFDASFFLKDVLPTGNPSVYASTLSNLILTKDIEGLDHFRILMHEAGNASSVNLPAEVLDKPESMGIQADLIASLCSFSGICAATPTLDDALLCEAMAEYRNIFSGRRPHFSDVLDKLVCALLPQMGPLLEKKRITEENFCLIVTTAARHLAAQNCIKDKYISGLAQLYKEDRFPTAGRDTLSQYNDLETELVQYLLANDPVSDFRTLTKSMQDMLLHMISDAEKTPNDCAGYRLIKSACQRNALTETEYEKLVLNMMERHQADFQTAQPIDGIIAEAYMKEALPLKALNAICANKSYELMLVRANLPKGYDQCPNALKKLLPQMLQGNWGENWADFAGERLLPVLTEKAPQSLLLDVAKAINHGKTAKLNTSAFIQTFAAIAIKEMLPPVFFSECNPLNDQVLTQMLNRGYLLNEESAMDQSAAALSLRFLHNPQNELSIPVIEALVTWHKGKMPYSARAQMLALSKNALGHRCLLPLIASYTASLLSDHTSTELVELFRQMEPSDAALRGTIMNGILADNRVDFVRKQYAKMNAEQGIQFWMELRNIRYLDADTLDGQLLNALDCINQSLSRRELASFYLARRVRLKEAGINANLLENCEMKWIAKNFQDAACMGDDLDLYMNLYRTLHLETTSFFRWMEIYQSARNVSEIEEEEKLSRMCNTVIRQAEELRRWNSYSPKWEEAALNPLKTAYEKARKTARPTQGARCLIIFLGITLHSYVNKEEERCTIDMNGLYDENRKQWNRLCDAADYMIKKNMKINSFFPDCILAYQPRKGHEPSFASLPEYRHRLHGRKDRVICAALLFLSTSSLAAAGYLIVQMVPLI